MDILSRESQKLVLSSVVRDPYLFGKVSSSLKSYYFTDPVLSSIYSSFDRYYQEFHCTPSRDELLIQGISVPDTPEEVVKAVISELYSLDISNEDLIKKSLEQFIRTNMLRTTLATYLDRLSNNDSSVLSELGSRLSKELGFTLNATDPFSLGDTSQYSSVRFQALGDGSSRVLKSSFPTINQSLMFGGYKPGDLVVVVAPPGCFVGSTKLMTFDGQTHTLEELYKSQSDLWVYGSDANGELSVGPASQIYLSGFTKDLVDVEIDGKYVIRSTRDHPYLTIDGVYVKAENLEVGSQLMSMYRYDYTNEKVVTNFSSKSETLGKVYEYISTAKKPSTGVVSDLLSRNYHSPEAKSQWVTSVDEFDHTINAQVTKVTLVELDNEVPVYGVVDAYPNNNYSIALNDQVGVFVSNTGKTSFLVHELSRFAVEGFNVLHLFIGDMVEYDGLVRYLSCLSKIPQSDILAMSVEDQVSLAGGLNMSGRVLDRIVCKSFAAGELDIYSLESVVKEIQSKLCIHFDAIAVDYPDNLMRTSDSMYDSGGDIFNELSAMARKNQSIVLAGSQPKITYWGEEIIPLEGCAESSKKQHIVDVMVAIGKPRRDLPVMTVSLPKVRRGETGRVFRVMSDFSKMEMNEISDFEYRTILEGTNQV